MTPEIAGKLLEHGTLGLLLAVALWVILKLYEANQAAAAARVAAAEEYLKKSTAAADEYLKKSEAQAQDFRARTDAAAASSLATATRMVEACTAAISAQSSVTLGHEKSLKELKELFSEYVDEVRRDSR